MKFEKGVKLTPSKGPALLGLRILYPFIISLVSPFVDIASTFFDSSFNLFATNTCFVLFEVTFLFMF